MLILFLVLVYFFIFYFLDIEDLGVRCFVNFLMLFKIFGWEYLVVVVWVGCI